MKLTSLKMIQGLRIPWFASRADECIVGHAGVHAIIPEGNSTSNVVFQTLNMLTANKDIFMWVMVIVTLSTKFVSLICLLLIRPSSRYKWSFPPLNGIPYSLLCVSVITWFNVFIIVYIFLGEEIKLNLTAIWNLNCKAFKPPLTQITQL